MILYINNKNGTKDRLGFNNISELNDFLIGYIGEYMKDRNIMELDIEIINIGE